MLLREKTLHSFGYDVDNLTNGSKKKICVRCDYCNEEYDVIHRNRINSNKIVDKDCCMKCRQKKKEDVVKHKYGVTNVMHLDSTKKKIVETNRDKYGVDYATQSELVKNKIKTTCLEKYGVEQVLSDPKHREKCKDVIKEKYGVEHIQQNPEIKEKTLQTNLRKYNKNHYSQTQEYKDRIFEKYGTRSVFGTDLVKEKIKNTMMSKYGVEHHMKVPDIQKESHKKGIETKKQNGQIKVFDGLTVSDMMEITGFSRSHMHNLIKEHGWEEAITMTPSMSSLEVHMKNILENNSLEYETQFKTGRYYTDFKVGNVLIECDGLYWHSDEHKQNDYHVKKRLHYIEQGYTPLFFRENEIKDKLPIVESILLHKLGISKREFARKLNLQWLTTSESSQFFNENHLMGSGRGKTLGLVSDDGIIMCAIQIVRRKETTYEVSRFCNKIGYTVVGGYSKVLKNFEKSNDMSVLFSFTDLRYGTGDHMGNFGFVPTSNYNSFKWTNGSQVWNRMKYPGKKGRELGLFRIYDCGQLRYDKIY